MYMHDKSFKDVSQATQEKNVQYCVLILITEWTVKERATGADASVMFPQDVWM